MRKIPVIIDCDTGIDDMISFAVTLTSDKLNILGITTAAGNQVVDITTQNTLNGVTIMRHSGGEGSGKATLETASGCRLHTR